MPTYQYRCSVCSQDVEAVQAFSDAPLTDCPACSGPLRKVFSAVGVVFKGSGFYRNDSRAAAKTSTSGEGSAAPAASPVPTGGSAAATGSGSSASSASSASSGAPGKSAKAATGSTAA